MIHSYITTLNFSDGHIGVSNLNYYAAFFQIIISKVFANISVPFFFVISGFLFFRNFELKHSIMKNKLHSRARTLLIPYIIWNISALVFFLIVQSFAGFSQYFSGQNKFVSDYELYDYLDSIIGISRYPVAGQFWFIRDLMIMIFFAPIFWLIAKYIPRTGILLFFSLWLIDSNMKFVNFLFYYYTVLFFYLGVLAAIKDFKIDWVDLHGRKILLTYLMLAVIESLLQIESFSLANQINRILIFPGILSAWYLVGKASKNKKVNNLLVKLSGFSFFVFAAFEPFLSGLKKVMYRILSPSSSLEVVAVYLSTPAVTIFFTLWLAEILRKNFPRIYNLLTGQR